MIDTFYIGAYWGSRRENVSEVADKTVKTLLDLKQLDEQFLNWYRTGMSRKKAMEKRFTTDQAEVQELYSKSVKKEELKDGFTTHIFKLGLWSGHSNDTSCGISFNVGGQFEGGLSNCCVIEMPVEGEARERLLRLEKIKLLIDVLVKNWRPERVVLVSQELKKTLHTVNEIGWVTYVANLNDRLKTSEKVVSEKFSDGYLFHLNLPNNKSYDYSLMHELLPLKKYLSNAEQLRLKGY